MSNASLTQYATPTPCVGCLTPPRATSLPHTGYDVALPLLFGVALIALGTVVRR